MSCRRFLVSGRVQGVFFRASTRERATQLGLVGRVVNLADGRVEVVACGADPALDALQTWLHAGPPAARVHTVDCEAVPDSFPVPEKFTIG